MSVIAKAIRFFKNTLLKTKTRFISFFTRQTLKSASRDRLYRKYRDKEIGANEALPELSIVRARANYAYLNDPFIFGAVNTVINRAIGSGSTVQAQTENEAFNSLVEDLFAEWCYDADLYRQYHFGEIQRLCMLKLFLDGGVFLRIVDDPKNSIARFSLEILEYSRLARGVAGQNIKNGIELNEDGIPVAYHFSKNETETIRIEADDIIHFSPGRRPGQLLGIPILSPAILFAYNLSDLIEAELINAKVSASFGLLIKKNEPYSAVQNLKENEEGERELEIAPGMVEFLEPNEDVVIVDPKRPGNTFEPFVKLVLRGIGRALGLSYEQISGDKSEVNYSSSRHSELEFRDYIEPLVKFLERYVLRRVYVEFIKRAILFGTLNVQGGIKTWGNWVKHKWVHKGFDWVDPLREIEAKKLELQLGLTTLADEAARKGRDWEEVAQQRRKEKEFLNSLGLVDVSQIQVDPKTVEAISLLQTILGGKNGNQG